MRGKGFDRCKENPASRITPAYAGKSGKHYEESMGNRDHPRLCGEKFGFEVESEETTGSPPPMRGKGITPSPIFCPAGITPAYAGKSAMKKYLGYVA